MPPKSAGQPHVQQADEEAVSVAKTGAFGSRIRIAPSFWQAFGERVCEGMPLGKQRITRPASGYAEQVMRRRVN